jgi:ATP-dependent Clp protease ATP-binding subunit ClpA
MIIFTKSKRRYYVQQRRSHAIRHDFIGTEHLMLGILREKEQKAIQILNNLDVDLEHLRRK